MTYRLQRGSVQWRFHESRAKLQVFGGAFANGKTTAAVIKALRIVSDYPGANILIARESYPKLRDTIEKVFFEWCPAHWIKRRPTQDDNTCYLTNGSVVNFRYIAQRGKKTAEGETSSNLLSATYDAIIIDQIEDPQITYKDFIDLLGRLRGQTTYRPVGAEDDTMPVTGPRWFIATCNPSANWFYRKIIRPLHVYEKTGQRTDDLLLDEETEKPIVELVEGDLYSNRMNLTPDFIRTQEIAYKGQMFKRYVKGEWAAYEGLVYDTFSQTRNALSREFIIDYLRDCNARHVAITTREAHDFGIVQPSCYMAGFVDDYGRLFILDGYHESGLDYSVQPAKMREIRARYSGLLRFKDSVYCDPSIFRKMVVAGQKVGTETIARLYSDMGLNVRPAVNDITQGITKVASYFNGREDVPHVESGETPGPLLYVCNDLSYYWKKNPLGQSIDEPQEHNDHAMDTLKYMMTRLPEASKIVIPEKALPPGYMFWHESDLERGDARG
jgi:hypothetical protein